MSDLVPQGLFFPEARYEGLTGHFNATGALVTGCLQDVDASGSEAPTAPTVFECFRKERRLPPEAAWVVASNKSFGLLGGSKLRFRVRDKMEPFSSLLLFSIPRPTDQVPILEDPFGSFVDVEQLSYYVWLKAEKTAAYRGKTLYLLLAEGSTRCW